MEARIINAVHFGGLYTTEWLELNQDKEVNGVLVSEWVLTPFLPDKDFKKPEFNGTEWVETYVEVIIVPSQVHNFKFRLALIHFGILPSSIDLAISQIEDPINQEQLFSLWNFAPFLERADPKLIAMATQFEINPEALDQIFIYANSI